MHEEGRKEERETEVAKVPKRPTIHLIRICSLTQIHRKAATSQIEEGYRIGKKYMWLPQQLGWEWHLVLLSLSSIVIPIPSL